MKLPVRRGIGAFVLASLVAGCGGGTPEPTAEEKSPTYGVDAMKQMQDMQGVPTPTGMQPAAPAAK